MTIRNTITKVITLAIVLSALAVISSSWAARRASAREIAVGDVTIKSIPAPIGFIPGQTLRFSVGNLTAEEEGSQPVRVQGYVYDSVGNLLSRTDPVQVPRGQFLTLNFRRDDLTAVGEPNTGRLQVRASIQVAFSGGSVRYLPEHFPISMELMETRTGGTVGGPYFTGYVTVSDD